MKFSNVRWSIAIAVAVVALVGARSAVAAPYAPTATEIKSLNNDTNNFSGGLQLSTIDAIHIEPKGIRLDITWRAGAQTADPFEPNYGETFTRVVLDGFQNSENGGAGRLLFPGYDGIKWVMQSDVQVTAQPFLMTAPSYSYYQPQNDTQVPGSKSITPVLLPFNSVSGGTGSIPLIGGEIRGFGWGFQIFGPGPTPGTSVQSQLWITPEPSTAVLLLMGLVGFAGRATSILA